MKKFLFVIVLFCTPTALLRAQETPVPPTDKQVYALMNDRDWFGLIRLYPRIERSLSPHVHLLCRALLDSRFNRLPESCEAIGTLLNEYREEITDEATIGNLLSTLIGNLRELGAYDKAAELLAQLPSDEENSSTAATVRWFRTMATTPRTTLSRPDEEVRLPLTIERERIVNPLTGRRKKIRNFYTCIKIGEKQERFLFDTGCSDASFVSQDFAERHGLRTICDSIEISGIGGRGYVGIATTDSILLGPVIVRNPYFMVFRNDDSAVPSELPDAVLGTDFMRLAGQIELRPAEGVLLLPAVPSPMPFERPNLMHDTTSGRYLIAVEIDGEKEAPMIFDTGSSGTTSLSRRYFLRHRERVERIGHLRETVSGGFGGIVRGTGYDLEEVTFAIGDGPRIRSAAIVSVDFDPPLESDSYGTLGTDFFRHFDRILFDFDRMFITVE